MLLRKLNCTLLYKKTNKKNLGCCFCAELSHPHLMCCTEKTLRIMVSLLFISLEWWCLPFLAPLVEWGMYGYLHRGSATDFFFPPFLHVIKLFPIFLAKWLLGEAKGKGKHHFVVRNKEGSPHSTLMCGSVPGRGGSAVIFLPFWSLPWESYQGLVSEDALIFKKWNSICDTTCDVLKSNNWIQIFDLLKSSGIGNFHPLKIWTRMSPVLLEQGLNNSTSRDLLHYQPFCDSLMLLDVLPNRGENSGPLSFQNSIFKWISCFSMNIIFNPLTDKDHSNSLWREQKNLPEGSENV